MKGKKAGVVGLGTMGSNIAIVCARAGVETAVGICHDGHYADVWATGVMAGARLCVHASAGGSGPPKDGGSIPEIVGSLENQGSRFDAYWLAVNTYCPGCVFYPMSNAKVPQTLLAVTDSLSQRSPTYPKHSYLGDELAHARIRLHDANGCYPMRTLRSGRAGYENWSRLVPEVVDV